MPRVGTLFMEPYMNGEEECREVKRVSQRQVSKQPLLFATHEGVLVTRE